MIIKEDDPNIYKDELGNCVYDGDIIADENLEIGFFGSFKCTGNIKITGHLICPFELICDGNVEAVRIKTGYLLVRGDVITTEMEIHASKAILCGGSIISSSSIIAGGLLKAHNCIKAGHSVYSGKEIYAGDDIAVGYRIFAGIAPLEVSIGCEKHVECGRLISGEVAYGELIENKKERLESENAIATRFDAEGSYSVPNADYVDYGLEYTSDTVRKLISGKRVESALIEYKSIGVDKETLIPYGRITYEIKFLKGENNDRIQ